MYDVMGRPIEPGDFIIYTSAAYGDMHFGYVLEIRESTQKIKLRRADKDGKKGFVSRYDRVSKETVVTEKEDTNYANYTSSDRFYIIRKA